MKTLRSVGFGLVAVVACASGPSVERRDYILAHAHGWVEVSILDADVPDVPTERDERVVIERPSSCYLTVSLDREPFAGSDVFPVGDTAPYELTMGYRFPAPVGPAVLELRYSGCDVNEGKAASVVLELPIRVEARSVSEVHFDGTALIADPLRPNRVVSLDDVYEAVTGKRTPGE